MQAPFGLPRLVPLSSPLYVVAVEGNYRHETSGGSGTETRCPLGKPARFRGFTCPRLREDARGVDVITHRIGQAIRNARVALGLSQGGLAEAVGVAQTTISKWELDAHPSLDQIEAVCEALGLPRGQLLRDAGYVDDAPASPEEAIRADRSLRPEDRRALLDVLAAYRGRGRREGPR